MTRDRINTFAAFTGVLLALSAAALVAVVLATGWQRNLPDEGGAAHLWQLLMAAAVVTLVAFLATADPKRRVRFLTLLGLQVAALAAALVPVAAVGL